MIMTVTFEIAGVEERLICLRINLQAAIGRVAVISDGAHAFGSVKNGVKAGAIADFTSFSFHG